MEKHTHPNGMKAGIIEVSFCQTALRVSMAKPPLSVAETYHLTPHDHVVGNSPLHSACYSGKLDIVKLLILEKPSDINGENHQGNTPLGLACKAGHKHVVSFLLTLSTCDLNHRNKAGNTPLHISCLEGNLDTVSLLCRERKCKVDLKNRHGDTPLGLACSSGNLDIVVFLVNQKDCNIATQDRNGNTPLHLACDIGHLGIVWFLTNLNPQCDPNSTNCNKDGDTPLHLACQNGWLGIVEYLTTEKGFDLNCHNRKGNTPLYTAIVSQQKDVAMFLCKLEHCDINHPNKEWNNALHLASSEGWSDVVDLTRQYDINSQNRKGNTALHIASLKGHRVVVEVLFQEFLIKQPSCNINCENRHGNTPLSLACQNGWEEIVKLLINVPDCKLNHTNKSGIASIHFACYNHHWRIVEILVRDERCDVECEDMNENTPLGLACHLGWRDIVEHLITERHSCVDSRNKYSDTSLHLACSRGYLEVVKLLVAEENCDINCRNNRGDTPFSLACQRSLEVVKFLSEQKECESLLQNDNGDTPLYHACTQSRLDVVKYLVDDLKHDVNSANDDGNTPLNCSLACSVKWKNLDIVQFLISLPQCHINHQNKVGDTALHIACRGGHADAVVLLSGVEHCNFNIQNNDGHTPAQVAMDLNHADIIGIPLPSLFTFVSQDKWISIINLLSRGRELTVPSHFQSKVDAVKFVVQHKLWDPKCPNEHGSIALHYTTCDLVEYLVHELGCDVNHQNKRGNTPLHVACLRGDLDTVRALTSIEKCDINLQNKRGNTPLHIACLRVGLDTVRTLISNKECHFTLQNKEGNTPMDIVCLQGDLNTVGILMSIQRYDINFQNKEGNTVLHVACLRGDLDTVRTLTSVEVRHININVQNKAGNTPLHYACLRGDLGTVRTLTSIAECNTNLQDEEGNTPLHIACHRGDLNTVRTLISIKGYDINLQNMEGNTPLHVACIRGDLDTVRTLTSNKECNTNLQDEEGNTPLHIACHRGDLNTVRTLISIKGYDINLQNMEGNTPLHVACLRGDPDTVATFTSIEGCDINLQNKEGNTPLHISCQMNGGHDFHIVKLLVADVHKSCDINCRNNRGDTPFSLACQSSLEVVKFLSAQNECQSFIQNSEGNAPLHHASAQNRLDIVKFLVNDLKHDVNYENNDGNTPLSWSLACKTRWMSSGIVEFFVSLPQCHINHQNKVGDTALHIACRNRCADAVVLLSGVEHCNFNLRNKCGLTPAMVAMTLNHTDILKLMLQEPHHIPSLLASVSQDNWVSISNVLGRGKELTMPPHFQSKLDAVRFVIEKQLWDPRCPNEHDSIALHFASSDLVEYLVHELGCDVNHQNHRGNTPLHVACLRGDLDTVRALTTIAECNTNLHDEEGNTPLHISCRGRHANVVAILSCVEYCNFNLWNECHQTPVMIAMDLNCTDILQVMVQEPHRIPSILASVSPEYWISIINLLSGGRELTMPPHFQSKFDAVRFVIEKQLWDPRCPNEHDSIALHFASSDLVEYLVHELGCDVNHQNKRGNTPLHVACLRGDLDTVRALTTIAECNINLQNISGNNALHLASSNDVIYHLVLVKHCDINSQGNNDNTALHIASFRGNQAVVKLLIERPSCVINCENRHGNTPLSLACQNGWEEIVKLLIQNCNLNNKNKSGMTPIHLACYNHHWRIVEILIRDERCDVECKDMNENTPLGLACNLGWRDIVEHLITERHSCVDSRNKYSDTSLHLACSRGYLEVVKLLVAEENCDINCRNNRGDTPFSLACQSSLEVVKFLSAQKECQSFIQNSEGNAPLHHASAQNRLDIVKFLVNDLKHDVNYENNDGNTPLSWSLACKTRWMSIGIVEFFVSLPQCHINHQNKVGDTALHIACRGGHAGSVALLSGVEHCNFNLWNECHQTPVMVAMDLNCTDILQVMVQEPHRIPSILASVSPEYWISIINLLSGGRELTMPPHFQSKLDAVRFVIENQLWDPRCPNEHDSIALHFASSDLVEYLVHELGCDVNHQNKRGNTPLHVACLRGDLDTVRALTYIEEYNMNLQNEAGNTPLHYACLRGDLDTVRTLTSNKECNINLHDEEGNTPLHIACHRGDLNTVRTLISIKGCDINLKNMEGNTPLHVACLRGDPDTVATFTSIEGCNINLQNKEGNTPSHIACQERHTDVLVLHSGVKHCNFNLYNKEGNTPLHVACLRGDLDTVRTLTSIAECNTNLQDEEGNTPLHIACHRGDLNTVRTLISIKGCDINLKNMEGNTPLHVACLRGDPDTVATFTSIEGCNINLQNKEGNTPSHIACQERHTDILVLLSGVKHCNFNLYNKEGNTPLHVACLRGYTNIVTVLTSIKKCNLILYNKEGHTALHVACLRGDLYTVRRVLTFMEECNVNHETVERTIPTIIETAVHIAFKNQHTDIVKLFIAKDRRSLLMLLKCITSAEWQDIVAILSGSNFPRPNFQSYLQVLQFLQDHEVWSLPDESGNTNLHAACSIGDDDLVKSLVSKPSYSIYTKNNNGDTPLHIACREGRVDIAEFLVIQHKYETKSNVSRVSGINLPNNVGNTPLHIACLSGRLSIVKILVSKKECNYNPQNAHHETPAIIAFNQGHRDILRLLITEQHCECLLSLLHATDRHKWFEVVHILTVLKTLNELRHPLEVITFLVNKHHWELNHPDMHGNTALHYACTADSDLVKFLVNDMSCDMQCQNGDGDTPMHIACQQGNLEEVKLMLNRCTGVNESACNLDVPNNQGDTPLHCACSKGHLQIVKMVLSSDLFDPTSCNAAGLTPIDLTTEYQVVNELSVYAKFRSSTSPPVWSNIKVCVVGDHSTGKTTLVEVLSREATLFSKFFARFRRVTDIECSTAGIILVRLQSKKFGNIILYDFAGHKEYYSSHAAVLENFRSKSPPPLFILLLKLTESMKDISEKLYYWTSMIENHCKLANKPPQVLVVGSFADKLKARSLQEVSAHVRQIINSFGATNPASDVVSSSLKFDGFIPLNCRKQVSGQMDELSKLLANTCQGLQESSDTSFGCHVLYTFLLEMFKGKVACSVADIMESVKTEDALALYNDAPSLVHLLKSLSDFGEIILLANQEKPNQGWVILDSKFLLSEINATIFAPEYFKRYKKGFVMSTGVVPFSKIQEVFPNYDSEMVSQFLIHLEYCQEIRDPSVLPDIRKTHQDLQQAASPSTAAAGGHTPVICYDQERYLFFPALVELEKPVRVWVDDETMQYKCGWFLQCIRPGKFLTTRFLHVLLLRLAFTYGLNPQWLSQESPQDDPVLRKQCPVWKSGIQWFSRTGIETVVEVREQTKVVAILMRCPKDKAVECAKLRSSVINKVLNMQREFCPAVTPMAESLIHPSDVQYPLKDARGLRLFTVNEIANLVIADPSDHETFAMEYIPRGIMDTADLLLFEPYLGLGAEIVQHLFISEKEITERFLNQLASQTFKRLSMYKKMINPNEAQYAELCWQANPVKQCYYLFELWSKRGNATFKALRQLFDRYSIFHGRNPLELTSSGPQLPGECSHKEDLLEHVDDAELAIDSLLLVRTELMTLTCWSDLGLAVQLLPHTLTAIRTSNRDDIHQCLTDVVAAWLERQDDVSKPSWRSLVEALLSPSVNCQVLARRIAETHSTSQETIRSTAEDSSMDKDIPGEGHGSPQGEDSSSQHEPKVQQPTTETYLSTTEHSTAQDSSECPGSCQEEDSSSQHDPETHQPTTEVSMQEVDDAILDEHSFQAVRALLVTGGTHVHLPWFSLGLVLGLYYGTLKAIQTENRDNQSGCLTDTLAAWLRHKDAVPEQGLPSWKTLARALAHPLVSQRSLVDEITRRHQKTEPSDN